MSSAERCCGIYLKVGCVFACIVIYHYYNTCMVSASSLDNTIISTAIRGRGPGSGRPRARTMSVLQCRQTRIQFVAPDLSKLTRFADHAISRTNYESSFHNLSDIKGPMINSVLIRPSATPDISPAPQSRSITLPLAELECGISMG
jgi:hypothetical protein